MMADSIEHVISYWVMFLLAFTIRVA